MLSEALVLDVVALRVQGLQSQLACSVRCWTLIGYMIHDDWILGSIIAAVLAGAAGVQGIRCDRASFPSEYLSMGFILKSLQTSGRHGVLGLEAPAVVLPGIVLSRASCACAADGRCLHLVSCNIRNSQGRVFGGTSLSGAHS